jgi:YVTN family beta-propeller protein
MLNSKSNKKGNVQKTKTILLLASAALLTFTACKKDDNDEPEPSTPDYTNGILVTNEGLYVNGTGSVSFRSHNTGNVTHNVFELQNDNRPLGNVVQSAGRIGDNIYFMVNNSNRIEVTNAVTMKSNGVINISQPRYMADAGNGKAYVTQWNGSNKGRVAIVDLNTKTVIKSITCGVAPEGVYKKGNFIYVANSGYYPNNDDTVTVIDAVTETVVAKVQVGTNPSAITEDVNGKLWVLCNGTFNDAALVRINPASNTVEQTVTIPNSGYQGRLTINKNKNVLVCNMFDKVYKLDITSSTPSVLVDRILYSVAINPSTDEFYGCDALDYQSNGWVLKYNYITGAAVDSFKVGIIPGNILFN